MKKLLPILLAAALLLPLAVSCAGTGDPETTTAETTTEEVTTADPSPAVIDLKNYKFVRPDSATAAEAKEYAACYSGAKSVTGYDGFTISDDFVKAGTPMVEVENEILLGPTNRKESSEALEGRSKTEYVIAVVGTKVVVNAGNRFALEYVLDLFVKTLTEGSTEIPADLCVRGDYEADSYAVELEGKTIAAMGDSYFGKDKTNVWIKLMADKYGMTLNNYGIGGATISNYVTDHNPMCDRISTMRAGADIVLFEGGRNDYNQKVPIGTIDSRDTKTVMGAINVCLDQLIAKYPEAMIIGVTTWYVNEKMVPYTKAMIDVCAARGIRCFDASNQQVTGVYMNDAAFRAKYCVGPDDVSHLNPEGMKLVEPAFEKYIAAEYKKFLAEKGN